MSEHSASVQKQGATRSPRTVTTDRQTASCVATARLAGQLAIDRQIELGSLTAIELLLVIKLVFWSILRVVSRQTLFKSRAFYSMRSKCPTSFTVYVLHAQPKAFKPSELTCFCNSASAHLLPLLMSAP